MDLINPVAFAAFAFAFMAFTVVIMLPLLRPADLDVSAATPDIGPWGPRDRHRLNPLWNSASGRIYQCNCGATGTEPEVEAAHAAQLRADASRSSRC